MFCPARHPTLRQPSLIFGPVRIASPTPRRRASAISMHPSFACRPLRLRNLREHDSAAANGPVQLRTRIVGLVATHIGGQYALTTRGPIVTHHVRQVYPMPKRNFWKWRIASFLFFQFALFSTAQSPQRGLKGGENSIRAHLHALQNNKNIISCSVV